LLVQLKTIWIENKKYVAGLANASLRELLLGALLIALGVYMLYKRDLIDTIFQLGRTGSAVVGIAFVYFGLISFFRVVNAWCKCRILKDILVVFLFLAEVFIRSLSKMASAVFNKANVSYVYTYWAEVVMGVNWAFLDAFFVCFIVDVLLKKTRLGLWTEKIQGSFTFLLELVVVIVMGVAFSISVKRSFCRLNKTTADRANVIVGRLISEMRTVVFMICLLVIVYVIGFCAQTDDVRYQCVNVSTVVVLWGTIIDRMHSINSEKDSPLLSVVIPVYNVAPYLGRCLESVINQSYTNLEIICVNDGSTDDSLSILQDYARKDSRIQIIDKPNGGLVSARKAGTEAAKGAYITQLDSNDYIAEGMYERLMTEAVSHQVDVVTSGLIRDYGSHMVYESEAATYGYYSDEKLQNLLSEIVSTDKFYKTNISLHVTNKVYRTELYKKHQTNVPDKVSIGDDAAVLFPLFYDCHSIYISGSNYYHYCIRPNAIMESIHVGKKDSLYCMFRYIENNTLPKSEESKEFFQKQFDVFSLYMRLLRNPGEVLKYEKGYLYPYGEVSKDDTLVLFGAEKFGVALKQFLDDNGFKKVIWVDQNVKRDGVITWREAKKMHFDKVIAGALVYDAVENMRKMVGKEHSKFLSVHI